MIILLVSEETLQRQKIENERHKQLSAAQEKLMLQYLDCVNNHSMSIDEFINKTNDFTDYWSDVAADADVANQNGIEIPERYLAKGWH